MILRFVLVIILTGGAARAEDAECSVACASAAGLVDTYLQHSFQTPGQAADLRVFDATADQPMVSFVQADLKVRVVERLQGRLQLIAGDGVEMLNGTTVPRDVDPAVALAFRHVQQLYVGGTLPWWNTQIEVGKFMASAGLEVVEAKDDWNHSRSFLFGYAVPYTVAGVRVSAFPREDLQLQLAVVNGTDVVLDNNPHKTVVAAAFYTGKQLTASASVHAGIESATSSAVRVIGDATISARLTSFLQVAANVDVGHEDGAAADGNNATWYGAAGYVKGELPLGFTLAARAEHFADPAGVRTPLGPGQFTEVTFTSGYRPLDKAELRVEYRHDWLSLMGGLRGQDTMSVAALAWF